MTAWSLRHRARDESGAVLILALIFMTVVALSIGALASWSGNDLTNTLRFKQNRSSLTTAEAAVQAQMTSMRYVYATTCPGTPYALNGATVVVTCTAKANPANNASRVITFSASPQGQSKVLVAAQVSFDDFSNTFNTNNCLASTPSPTTCGSGMTINSWVITPGA